MILLLIGVAMGLGIGYAAGTMQTNREARATMAVMRAQLRDLSRLLNECNGVKPVEAGKP